METDKIPLKSRLSSHFQRYLRVWRLLKKPSYYEFKTIAKVSALGLLIIGAITIMFSSSSSDEGIFTLVLVLGIIFHIVFSFTTPTNIHYEYVPVSQYIITKTDDIIFVHTISEKNVAKTFSSELKKDFDKWDNIKEPLYIKKGFNWLNDETGDDELTNKIPENK